MPNNNDSLYMSTFFADVNNFIFANNNVERLDGEAFQMNINGRISFERNNFSQFSHLALSGMLSSL